MILYQFDAIILGLCALGNLRPREGVFSCDVAVSGVSHRQEIARILLDGGCIILRELAGLRGRTLPTFSKSF